jgi:uncharacterized protein
MPDHASPAVPARVLPELQDRNREFWTAGADGRLFISQCTQCSLWVSPPADDCPECGAGLEARPVSGRGKVFTFTVNRQPFNPAVPVPYVIAIIELEEQRDLRLAANIVDCEPDSVYTGMPVEVRFERQHAGDEVVYVPVFAPPSA